MSKCMFDSELKTMYVTGISSKKNYDSVPKFDIRGCKWINNSDKVQKVADNVYEVKKNSGIYFKINKIGNFFITAAHCLDKEHASQCVEGHDIAIYNTQTGKQGDKVWGSFKNQLVSGKFHNQIYQVNTPQSFKPGDSGLLCSMVNSKGKNQCTLLDCGDAKGVLLVSGGTTLKLCNGLLPTQKKYGSAGSNVGGTWTPRDKTVMVFSGREGESKEMFGVRWLEFEKHSKIKTVITHPYHILNAEEKIIANTHHQFPDLVTEKIFDIKQIKQVKVPEQNGGKCHVLNLNKKIFSSHETDNRFIFAILPAFETHGELSFKSGTPIFNAETDELISCVTKSYNNVYAVSGIGWESGQIEKDKNWIGVQYNYVGKGESVYGNYHGPYSEVKKLAAAKALEEFGEKTGLGIYMQDKMVQVVSYDENGKERWRVRLFHEDCQIADSAS